MAIVLLMSGGMLSLDGTAAAVPGGAALTAPAAVSVDVTAPLSPPRRLGSKDCGYLRTASSPDGLLRGFVSCSNRLTYVTGGPAGWTLAPTSVIGAVPVAVADDGGATYLLYRVVAEFPPPVYSEWTIRLLKRDRAGVVHDQLVDDGVGGIYAGNDGAMVAAGGRWWAVWTVVPGGNAPVLYQARTMGTVQGSHDTGVVGRSPSMVLRGGTVTMAYERTCNLPSTAVAMVKASVTDGTWTAPQVVPGTCGAHSPALQLDGSVLRLAYYADPLSDSYRMVVKERTAGTWTTHVMTAGGLRLAFGTSTPLASPQFVGSGMNTVLGWGGGTSHLIGCCTLSVEELHVQLAQRTATGWRERKVSTPSAYVQLNALGLVNGKIVLGTSVESDLPIGTRGTFTRTQ